MVSRTELWLQGYRLTTAEILYHMPDHPDLLQTYVWQEFDLAPRFPELKKFLDFWEANLDGKLHSVSVASTTLVTPAELRAADVSMALH
ncbi:MAG: Usg family protein [Alphaproteobacteria bacterium]|nr:MAG: Usg family protein [Alphaproteobacteria bacterium]